MKQTIKRIFVTGATGFIGSSLITALVADGYEIGILIRKGSDLSRISEVISSISVYGGDVRDGDEISCIFGEFKPDAILHLVTYYAVEHVPQDIGVMVDTNVKGTINLLDASRIHGVKLFVNTSTCAVYGQKGRPLKETDAVSPQNLYAVTKVQAEEACKFYAYNYIVDGITLRLFPPYGPGDHKRRLIPYVITSLLENKSPALTTGKQQWDFVYIDDIVNAYRAVLSAYPFKSSYDEINIGTGKPESIRDVVLMIKQMTGSECELSWGAVPHRKSEVWFNSADITKASRLLGWTPAICLQEGLQKTIQLRKW
jgi:nucleoside-diphosphate-sugar epimerase